MIQVKNLKKKNQQQNTTVFKPHHGVAEQNNCFDYFAGCFPVSIPFSFLQQHNSGDSCLACDSLYIFSRQL